MVFDLFWFEIIFHLKTVSSIEWVARNLNNIFGTKVWNLRPGRSWFEMYRGKGFNSLAPAHIITWPLNNIFEEWISTDLFETSFGMFKPVVYTMIFRLPYKYTHPYLFISFTFQAFWWTELFVAITVLEKAISFSVLVVEYIYFDNGHHWFVVVCRVAEHVPVPRCFKSRWVSVT
jgi:hypothetical protein